MKQAEGLVWDDYEKQRSSAEHKEWYDSFNAIAEVKFITNRILRKPDPSQYLDYTLLEKLYEDSQ